MPGFLPLSVILILCLPLLSLFFHFLFLLFGGFVLQPTASLSARMEECASGLSSVSASRAQRGRHANRRWCPHTPFQQCLGMDPQMGTPLATLMDTTLVTPMDTMWYSSGPYLSKCLPMVMPQLRHQLATWLR